MHDILVACEESQAVTLAFRDLGYNAFSCDLQPCSGGFPEWHIQGDVLPLLELDWDLIIAFPPCTYLTKAGANRLKVNGVIDSDRYNKGLAARDFFMRFYNITSCPVAIENPVSLACFNLPQYSQVIQPYFFGHPVSKRTHLWLKGLPPLFPTDLVIPESDFLHSSIYNDCERSARQCYRSKTLPGVASAMAHQWSEFLFK